MPLFEFKAIAESGEIIIGEQQASDRQVVIDYLHKAGHMPVYARERNKSSRLSFLFKPRKKTALKAKDMALLLGELATLLEAGLALDHALARVQRLAKSPKLKKLLERMLKGLQQGEGLADIMVRESDTFSSLQISLVRAGEASGSLHLVMAELAEYQESMLHLRQTVVTSMIYPVILVVMSLLSLLVMMIFVVPQFVPLFEGSDRPLPWLTAVVFNLASGFQQFWWLPLVVFIVVALLFEMLGKTPQQKQQIDAMLLKMPLFGTLLQTVNAARFARTLGSLLSHDVSLLKAVTLAQGAISNTAMQAALDNSKLALEQGKKLSASLKPSGLFPELLLELIEVGEESGQLPKMLAKAAKVYDNEVQTRTRRMLTIIEPVMIVGLGIVIGLIVIAIMLAMLGLNDLVV